MIGSRLVGLILVVTGLVTALMAGTLLVSPRRFQPGQGANRIPPSIEASAAPSPGDPIGVIDIPRLGLSSVVLEGDDTVTLLVGVGHLSETPLPWRGGNSVLAGHRDTFFRGLARIRARDIVRFRTAGAEREYRVERTAVVEPADIEVLAPTTTPTLTLITCYPFRYIGPAPKRFVVTARLMGEAVP